MYIPEKKSWKTLRASRLSHKVHPPSEAVPADRGICSLGTSQEINKGESPIIKEDGNPKADDEGIKTDLWYLWVIELYPLVLTPKLKRYPKGKCVL